MTPVRFPPLPRHLVPWPCHLRQDDRVGVLDVMQWGLAVHLAAITGWQPQLSTYTEMTGQTIAAEDAAALAAGIRTALSRYRELTDAERAIAFLVLHGPTQGLAVNRMQRLNGGTVTPYQDLAHMLLNERRSRDDVDQAATTWRVLEAAAAWLEAGPVTLHAGAPDGWVPADTELVLVRVRPRPAGEYVGAAEGINLGAGEIAQPGDLKLLTADRARALIADAVVDLAA